MSHECPNDVRARPVTRTEQNNIVGALLRLWGMFYTDGEGIDNKDSVLDMPVCDVDDDVGITGFCRALEQVGWLTIKDNLLIANGLVEHFGSTEESRKYERERKQETRTRDRKMSQGCPKDVPEKSRLEENRTEEKRKSPHSPPKGDDDAKKHPRTIPAYTEAFNAFWNRYPPSNRVNKKGAFRVWCKQHIEREAEPGKPRMLDFVMAGLDKWCQCERWKAGFVCMPTTFLNQARWSNDPPHDERQP